MTATLVLFAILAAKNKPNPQPTLLDQYLKEAEAHHSQEPRQSLPGAIWSPDARLDESGRDVRATQVNDVVTILVTENVNAVASGASSTERQSSANQSITKLAGIRSPAGALVNMLGTSGDQKLNGTGTTSRASTLTATLTARVVRVLPGGLLLVEGEKNIQVNAE
ncbi:MAG TPA: flagellar basal body L-ring protein FlgH, partial [Bryobacteraceae bacterium]|nr:flagellar basal body L-ring protein FlgH [Bryobacteraceae bacterium]